ncbi:type III secretion system outer membrane ring subunit SctC [Roseateles sp. L2-2]|uniref:type III secretion system outer membrane ring subunit SctC n=1 Tax=Roseateles sp. L2-2 TaxID=3422597 RepID=UPI003D35CA59
MRRAAALMRASLRAVLCTVALSGPIGPAITEAVAVAPAAWRDTLYSYRADEELTLTQVLDRFSSTLGLEVKLADPALGRRKLKLSGKGASPAVFLDRLGDSLGLDWFIYQGVLHVSARSAATSDRIPLGPQSPSDAKDALVGIGLFESRFGWGEFDSDPPTVLVSGPPAYVSLIRRMLAVPEDKAPRRERPRMMVFRLKHASAADREMRTRDRVVTVPGLVTTLNQVLPNARSVSLQAHSPNAREGATTSSLSGAQDPWAVLAREMAGGDSAGDAAMAGIPAARLPLASSTDGSAPKRGPASMATSLASESSGQFRRSGRGNDAEEPEFVPSIAAYTPLNAVLVWDLPSHRDDYRELIDALDVPSRLIEINVTILDVSADALRDWSVDLQAGSGAARVSLDAGGSLGATSGDTGVKGSTMVLWASNRLELRVRALESRGQAQVLSRPSILTLNNVGALLDMNQSAYVKLVGERSTDLRTITAGTLLKVTPSIVGDDAGGADQGIRVTLDIEDGQLTNAKTDQGTPSVGNSAVSTEAVVKPGESLVVGGYRRQDRQITNSRVPGLSSIPLIGALFRSDSAVNSERERLFILTARALP